MKKCITLDLKTHERLVVISDVHGHLNHLKTLLGQVDLRDEDYLIILGDFINRGQDSLATLLYVYALSKRPRTFVLKGNHECFMETLMGDFNHFKRFEDFIKDEAYGTIIQSMLTHKGKSFDDFQSFRAVYDYIGCHFKDLVDFMGHLDIIVEEDKHLFVHGGYDKSFDTEDQMKFLKYDHYNDLSGINDKYVVVGHWPASNLRHDRIDNRPYFNHDKRIIFIDGGLGVKATGELNALLMVKQKQGYTYTCHQVHDFEAYRINKTRTFETSKSLYINYPDFDFDVVEENDTTTVGRHLKSGQTFRIFNELLGPDGRLTTSYLYNFLNLAWRTPVYLVKTIGPWALVKYQDTFGWVALDQLEKRG